MAEVLHQIVYRDTETDQRRFIDIGDSFNRETILESERVELRNQVAQLQSENQRLSAENAGLREDRERLDWLASNRVEVACSGPSFSQWRINYGDWNSDLRSAIDAARGGK